MEGTVHKLILYADDMFSKLSGYKVNWLRSEALPLTAYCPVSFFQPAPFQWPKQGIRYFGILFPHKLKDLVTVNLEPLLQKISNDVGRWSSLNFSLWGEVNVLKMNCLPRINYLLQSIPVEIPLQYFKQFDKLSKSFLWNNKRPWLHRSKLQQLVDKGGLGLPNFCFIITPSV